MPPATCRSHSCHWCVASPSVCHAPAPASEAAGMLEQRGGARQCCAAPSASCATPMRWPLPRDSPRLPAPGLPDAVSVSDEGCMAAHNPAGCAAEHAQPVYHAGAARRWCWASNQTRQRTGTAPSSNSRVGKRMGSPGSPGQKGKKWAAHLGSFSSRVSRSRARARSLDSTICRRGRQGPASCGWPPQVVHAAAGPAR